MTPTRLTIEPLEPRQMMAAVFAIACLAGALSVAVLPATESQKPNIIRPHIGKYVSYVGTSDSGDECEVSGRIISFDAATVVVFVRGRGPEFLPITKTQWIWLDSEK